MKLYIRQKQRYWLITNPAKSKHLRDRRYIVTYYEQHVYHIVELPTRLNSTRLAATLTSACEGGGFSTSGAQIQVKTFGSRKYKSHRRITDAVAHAVDAV